MTLKDYESNLASILSLFSGHVKHKIDDNSSASEKDDTTNLTTATNHSIFTEDKKRLMRTITFYLRKTSFQQDDKADHW